ncbi:hypothetical protein CM15mP35_03460 [bacterium]|nr:MAG: hypothetical protein CM15mP35_03460 [bacterium]
MSDEDYRYITKKSYKNQIASWIKKYNITLFILTLGDKGAILFTKKYYIKIKAKKVYTKIQLEQVIVLLQGVIFI